MSDPGAYTPEPPYCYACGAPITEADAGYCDECWREIEAGDDWGDWDDEQDDDWEEIE